MGENPVQVSCRPSHVMAVSLFTVTQETLLLKTMPCSPGLLCPVCVFRPAETLVFKAAPPTRTDHRASSLCWSVLNWWGIVVLGHSHQWYSAWFRSWLLCASCPASWQEMPLEASGDGPDTCFAATHLSEKPRGVPKCFRWHLWSVANGNTWIHYLSAGLPFTEGCPSI